MSLHYGLAPFHEERFSTLEHDLTMKQFDAFRKEFEEYFGTAPVRVAVKNGHWREAYAGPQQGLQQMHGLVSIDNGIMDHDGDFIILLGTCKYAFLENGLYIMSTWEGFSEDFKMREKKTRMHLIMRE